MQNVPVTEATAAPSALGQTPDTEPRLGAVVQTDGTTFTLWAPAAERVELALVGDDGSQRNLDLAHTGEFWTGFVPGVGDGQRYGYRVHGPFDPSHGLRFNPSKLLLDPYARAVDGSLDFSSPLIYDSSDGDSVPSPDAWSPRMLRLAPRLPTHQRAHIPIPAHWSGRGAANSRRVRSTACAQQTVRCMWICEAGTCL